jgi:hypothetical protein
MSLAPHDHVVKAAPLPGDGSLFRVALRSCARGKPRPLCLHYARGCALATGAHAGRNWQAGIRPVAYETGRASAALPVSLSWELLTTDGAQLGSELIMARVGAVDPNLGFLCLWQRPPTDLLY